MNKFFTNSFKALALLALLSNLKGFAMDAPLTPPASNQEKLNVPAQGCDCKFKAAISKAWTNTSKAFSEKKADLFKYANTMKTQGWAGWTNKEKAGIVIGSAVVAAATGYLVYKIYQKFTAPKANTRNNRA